MNRIQAIFDLAEKNNGLVTTAMVSQAGFSRSLLNYLVGKGLLERSGRGVYVLPHIFEDEFVNLQVRYKKGIFSLETALFLWDLCDRTPDRYHMTFPASYNLSHPKQDGILCHNSSDSFYDLGLTEIRTPGGNFVKVYNPERTLCDILRTVNHVDIQVVSDAFKRYIQRKNRNIPLLSDYAGILKVDNRLRFYLDVLL